MERITGPVRGLYIASYAQQCCEGEWVAYSKLCRERPESYWDTQGCAKIGGKQSQATAEEALCDVERKARERALHHAELDYMRSRFVAAFR
jgi:hypothetical protein